LPKGLLTKPPLIERSVGSLRFCGLKGEIFELQVVAACTIEPTQFSGLFEH
jgi:hypothetical protein